MKKLFILFSLVGSLAIAQMTPTYNFECVTDKGLDKGKTRTIGFQLVFDAAGSAKSVVKNHGRVAFRIAPYSEALRALNTADNSSLQSLSDRISYNADEIGMYNTELVLWKATGYHSGFVRTSGESNDKLYSPITCTVK